MKSPRTAVAGGGAARSLLTAHAWWTMDSPTEDAMAVELAELTVLGGAGGAGAAAGGDGTAASSQRDARECCTTTEVSSRTAVTGAVCAARLARFGCPRGHEGWRSRYI